MELVNILVLHAMDAVNVSCSDTSGAQHFFCFTCITAKLLYLHEGTPTIQSAIQRDIYINDADLSLSLSLALTHKPLFVSLCAYVSHLFW